MIDIEARIRQHVEKAIAKHPRLCDSLSCRNVLVNNAMCDAVQVKNDEDENEQLKETIEDHISDKREMVLRNLRKESIKLHSLDLHRMMRYAACKMNIIAKAYKRKANKIKEHM